MDGRKKLYSERRVWSFVKITVVNHTGGQSMQARSTIHSRHIWRWLPTLTHLTLTLKYLTVFTFNSRVASLAAHKHCAGCCWKADTVHMWFTPPQWPCTEQTPCEHLWWGSSPGDQKTSLWWEKTANGSRHLNSSLATQNDPKHACFYVAFKSLAWVHCAPCSMCLSQE